MPSEGDGSGEQEFEWEFFVYDKDAQRYSLWLQQGDEGVCLYDRPPEGDGMWLSPERDTDKDPVEPSEHLKTLLGELVGQENVEQTEVQVLDAHERHFFEVVHDTANENPDGIPYPVWDWMWGCREELVEG